MEEGREREEERARSRRYARGGRSSTVPGGVSLHSTRRCTAARVFAVRERRDGEGADDAGAVVVVEADVLRAQPRERAQARALRKLRRSLSPVRASAPPAARKHIARPVSRRCAIRARRRDMRFTAPAEGGVRQRRVTV
eukprot:3749647-Pleurochrysis_carterae.AAC.1